MLTKKEVLIAADRADVYPKGYGRFWGASPALMRGEYAIHWGRIKRLDKG